MTRWQRCAAFLSSDGLPDPKSFLHSGTLSDHANTQSQWRWFPHTNAPISRSKPSPHPDHCHQNSRLIRLCKPPVRRNLLKWDLRKGGLLLPVSPSYKVVKMYKVESFSLKCIFCYGRQVSSLSRRKMWDCTNSRSKSKKGSWWQKEALIVVETTPLTFPLTDCRL